MVEPDKSQLTTQYDAEKVRSACRLAKTADTHS